VFFTQVFSSVSHLTLLFQEVRSMDQFLPVKKTIRLQQWQQRIIEFPPSGMK